MFQCQKNKQGIPFVHAVCTIDGIYCYRCFSGNNWTTSELTAKCGRWSLTHILQAVALGWMENRHTRPPEGSGVDRLLSSYYPPHHKKQKTPQRTCKLYAIFIRFTGATARLLFNNKKRYAGDTHCCGTVDPEAQVFFLLRARIIGSG